ncbi:MAG: DeoR family transcriptional regulator [Candidatus Brocadiia bacterium]
MATQVQAPAKASTSLRSELSAVIRRRFLYDSYADMGRRAGVSASVVERRFREMYGCGVRAKRLEVRRAYIVRGPRLRDEEIGRQLGISRKQVVEIRSQLRASGRFEGRKAGLPTRDGQARRRARRAYIGEHYAAQTKQEMAKALGVSTETVRLDFNELHRRGLVQPLYRCRLEYVAAHLHKPEKELAHEQGISVFGVRFIKRRLRELRETMNLLRCQVEKQIRNRYAPATGEYVVECMRRALDVLELPQQQVLLQHAPRFKDGDMQPIFWHLVRTDVQGRQRMIRKIESGVTDLKELERAN